MSSTSFVAVFEGVPFNTLIDYSGPAPVFYFIPREVGEAIGYANPRELAERITARWGGDLEEGTDYARFTHAELQDKFPSPKNEGLGFTSRGMILLTEQGLYRVLMFARYGGSMLTHP